jgi:hypothetical protein
MVEQVKRTKFSGSFLATAAETVDLIVSRYSLLSPFASNAVMTCMVFFEIVFMVFVKFVHIKTTPPARKGFSITQRVHQHDPFLTG